MQDRRETDKIILDRLDKIQEDQTQLKVNLALNTQSTTGIENHLATLNGKVAAHNASIQEMQAKETVAALTLAELKAEKIEEKQQKEDKAKDKNANWNKLFWIIIGIVFALAGRIITYAEQSDFFKHIIK